jgi:hypothetical protein
MSANRLLPIVWLTFLISAVCAPAAEEILLFSFDNATSGGIGPNGLTPDAKGNLYGTTLDGLAFELSPPKPAGGPWTETVLYQFTDGSDGGHPTSGLVWIMPAICTVRPR